MFDGQPWFDGFRDLATNCVDKAVLNAFRMLGKLGGDWIAAESSGQLPLDDILARGVRDTADVGCVATRDEGGVSILVWNYHDEDSDLEETASLTIDVEGPPNARVRCSEFRMDADHSNAFSVWKAMGSPQQPAAEQLAELEAASQLAQLSAEESEVEDGRLQLECDLPRRGVGLFRIAF